MIHDSDEIAFSRYLSGRPARRKQLPDCEAGMAILDLNLNLISGSTDGEGNRGVHDRRLSHAGHWEQVRDIVHRFPESVNSVKKYHDWGGEQFCFIVQRMFSTSGDQTGWMVVNIGVSGVVTGYLDSVVSEDHATSALK
jgi:hypothetical protein